MQFDLRTMAEHMGGVAWGVVIVLALMSIYSIGVMIERYYTYSQATKQSRKYAPEVARFLKQGKIKEAIDASHGPTVKHSHLAKVLVVGLQEWQYQQEIGEATRDRDAAVDAAKRAIQRATAVNLADLKRGLSGLATIGSTAPFVGLFGTTFGIINAGGMALRLRRYRGHLRRHRRSPDHHRLRPVCGGAGGGPTTTRQPVEGFNVEMDNWSSELLIHQERGAKAPSFGDPPGGKEFRHAQSATKGGAIADIDAHGRHHDRPLIIFMITPMLQKAWTRSLCGQHRGAQDDKASPSR
jgi:hypothetical protein